jgi:hypothetical protein
MARWNSKNPLYLNKKATDKHPNHNTKDGRSVACYPCTVKHLRQIIESPLCTECQLPTIIRVPDDSPSRETNCEFYCTACMTHWGRVKDW